MSVAGIRMRSIAALALISCVVLGARALGQTGWMARSTAIQPSGRYAAAMVFDAARQRIVLFGGRDTRAVGETWEWDGVAWSRLAIAEPSARCCHAMAYDAGRQRVVLFGGLDAAGVELDDTWEFDGVAWTQRNPPTRPSPRATMSMVYDAARGTTVLFGGATRAATARLDETWEWDGDDWILRDPPVRPRGRQAFGMAYDERRSRVVVFGGADTNAVLDDTWEWDGDTWEERTPSASPSRRSGLCMAYDPVRQTTVAYGGVGPAGAFVPNQTFEWDGIGWSTVAAGTGPPGREFGVMAFDAARARLVLFGGNGIGWLQDTWELDPFSARAWSFGSGCPGPSGVPVLVGQPPRLGMPFALEASALPPGESALLVFGGSVDQFGGLALPLPLAGFGMPGCTLFVSLDVVVPMVGAAGLGSFTTTVPNVPPLLGGVFHNQCLVGAPGVNPANLIVSNAVTAWIGS